MSSLADKLRQLQADAEQAFESASDSNAVEALRVRFLGAKQGLLKTLQKEMGGVAKEEKPDVGKLFNETKQRLTGLLEAAQARLDSQAAPQSAEWFDPTLPGRVMGRLAPARLGRLHPITQTMEELKEIMGRLGFTVADGPEIEDERHNFEALNIPREHPARDPLDNFYLKAAAGSAAGSGGQLLLRSQTSTVQIRVMETTPPPIRIISLGRVYRPDTADATHYPMFHQMEGLLVDERVTLTDLKATLTMFAQSYLGSGVEIRFRPSFFPFTEPSVEVDMSWNGGWLEVGGAGMVDPNVLAAVGYDPEAVTGFAFGLGVERLCMRRHGVSDIRDLFKNDVRLLGQF